MRLTTAIFIICSTIIGCTSDDQNQARNLKNNGLLFYHYDQIDHFYYPARVEEVMEVHYDNDSVSVIADSNKLKLISDNFSFETRDTLLISLLDSMGFTRTNISQKYFPKSMRYLLKKNSRKHIDQHVSQYLEIFCIQKE